MDETAWLTISIVGYSLAAVIFVVAVVLFLKMNILAIIGDLTGRTAAKQIQEIRERNAMTGNKRHRPLERGLWTAGKSFKMSKTDQTIAHRSKWLSGSGQTKEASHPTEIETLPTMVLHEHEFARETSAVRSEDTTVLSEDTVVLFAEDATEVLASDTVVLDRSAKETTVLNPTVELENIEEPEIEPVEFKIVKDIKITHTNEVI